MRGYFHDERAREIVKSGRMQFVLKYGALKGALFGVVASLALWGINYDFRVEWLVSRDFLARLAILVIGFAIYFTIRNYLLFKQIKKRVEGR